MNRWGWIYVLECEETGALKIGFTERDPRKRAKEVDGTGTPFPLQLRLALPGWEADEAALHGKFAETRIRQNREWFRPSADIEGFIAARSRERSQDPDSSASEYLEFLDFAERAGWKFATEVTVAPMCLWDVRRATDAAGKALIDAWLVHQSELQYRSFDDGVEYGRYQVHCEVAELGARAHEWVVDVQISSLLGGADVTTRMGRDLAYNGAIEILRATPDSKAKWEQATRVANVLRLDALEESVFGERISRFDGVQIGVAV
jgi:hypothetical protein